MMLWPDHWHRVSGTAVPSTHRLVPTPDYTMLIETNGDGKANFPGREQSAASALAASAANYLQYAKAGH